MAPEGKVGLDPLLEAGESQLLQTPDQALKEAGLRDDSRSRIIEADEGPPLEGQR